MRVHHKPPTLVSMWMLDVFCCALGCVTLLFLLNSRMATDAVKANQNALLDLESADKRLAASIASLESTRARLLSEEDARGKLMLSMADLESLHRKLTDETRALAKELDLAQKEKDATAKKLALANDDIKAAQTQLDAKQAALSTAEKNANLTTKELEEARKKLALARDDIKLTQAQLDAKQAELTAAEKKAATTTKDLESARSKVDDATDLLKKRQKDIELLMKKDADAASQIADLQKLVRDKDAERLAKETTLAATKKELTDVEAKLRALQGELDKNLLAAQKATKAAAEELAAAKALAAKTGEELATARAQIKDLTKKIDDTNVTIIDLQGEKAKLADNINKFQKESDARFAGIAMTGKKVVLLVDMSGSMGKRDLNTVDETKWPLVIETVCKVMRSIPTLESYQVIIFSSGASWVFGDGEWQTFSGEKSVELVKDTLLKVKPKDDTNMYAALEKAFTLRAAGLDTIYLFSDGLPTSGPGLTLAQQNANPPLPETELGIILGKHVRDVLTRNWNKPIAGQTRVKINSVGFYFDSPDVGAFLWSLSRDNDGSFVGMSKP